jgi:hypothetical protein
MNWGPCKGARVGERTFAWPMSISKWELLVSFFSSLFHCCDISMLMFLWPYKWQNIGSCHLQDICFCVLCTNNIELNIPSCKVSYKIGRFFQRIQDQSSDFLLRKLGVTKWMDWMIIGGYQTIH